MVENGVDQHVLTNGKENGRVSNLSERLLRDVAEKRQRYESRPASDHLEQLLRGEIPLYTNASQLVGAALMTPPPYELETGYMEYPALSERNDEFAVVGMHATKEKIVQYLERGEETGGKDKMLLLVAPSGAGKTTLIESIKRAIVTYTDTTDKPLYGIEDCPVHDDPSLIISSLGGEEVRQEAHEHGMCVKGELCADCQQRLEDGNYKIDALKIKRVGFSTSLGRGIVKIEPTDGLSLNADPESAKKLGNKILNANRGLLHISEFCRYPNEFYNTLPDLVRGRRLSTDKGVFQLDAVMIADTTFQEWREFEGKRKNKDQALLNRLDVVFVPFRLSKSEEADIYRKFLNSWGVSFFEESGENTAQESVHMSAKTLDVLAEVAVRSRLIDFSLPDDIKDKVQGGTMNADQKIDYYDGATVGQVTQRYRRAIEEESLAALEGIKTGVSPDFMAEVLGNLIAKDEACINPIQALVELRKSVRTNDTLPQNEKAKFESTSIAPTEKRVDTWLADTIKKAFREKYGEACQVYFDNYLDTLGIIVNKEEGRFNPKTGEVEPLTQADFSMMETIENLGTGEKLPDEERNELRKDIIHAQAARARKGGTLLWEDVIWMKSGLEKFVESITEQKGMVLQTTGLPDEEAQEKIQQIGDTLIAHYGFCPCCVPELLEYAVKNKLL